MTEPARARGTRIVDARFLAGAAPGAGSLPAPTTVEIAFAGRSNVGKSSLINTLLERKSLVRTSSTPGSTRQINLYEARAQDDAVFHLVDLPGYGFTRRSKAETASWQALVEGYIRERVTLAAVLVLVDVRRGLEEDDLELVRFVAEARDVSRRPVQVVVVATKLDKVPRSSRRVEIERVRRAALAEMPASAGEGAPRPRVLGFSSVTGEGREELWSAIRAAALGVPAAV